MKNLVTVITLFALGLAIYWGFRASMPIYEEDSKAPATSFSTDRAMEHVKNISKEPHAVGFTGHQKVQDYIVSELRAMGLETSLQQGYTAGDWANLSKATNILARIKGTQPGKALLLLSHYDSAPHSSMGASDAGSGVATILEGLRAFMAQKGTHRNDIMILMSDAEELGLNGADLFVDRHPWAKEVGLVLNFEARGSGGPSYMLIETNRGNGNLIKEFVAAQPAYPVANSLVYSIYKMLPNDTDLTVFREDRDIEGLNFAFIDDHFDYHTARDTYDRLDKNTLAHQGSYLMPLLSHFSNADLSRLKSLDDRIYFNVPFFKLVSYPFEWIWPMFGLAIVLFVVFLTYGFRKRTLSLKEILKGFLPLLLALLINGIIGFYSWTALKWIYPQYKDMLHGFTYNGYLYIAAFVGLSIAICFLVYHRFGRLGAANLLVPPLFVWLLICGAVSALLPGAAFFTVPLLAFLASFFILLVQREPNPFLLLFLALPALWIYSPFIKMFPVGLGLKMMVAATLLTTLTFFLLLPIFGQYTSKGRLSLLGFLVFVLFMMGAHLNSGFSVENARPNSLLYVYDSDKNSAQWATYDTQVDSWNRPYFGEGKESMEAGSEHILGSKYGTPITFVAPAPLKKMKSPLVEKTQDTILGDSRHLTVCITPQRKVNRLEVFVNDVPLTSAIVNGIPLSDFYLQGPRNGKLVTHFISDNDYTELEITFPKEKKLELTLYEASNDLLSNPLFAVPERPSNAIPMPFVLNDAVVTRKTVLY
tara:strand:- start:16903 stop:19185 length:2283 start_codon:yes stop_codon:yes gene_type:complete